MKLQSTIQNFLDGKRFYIVLGVVILVGIFFRTFNITADAPKGFTLSQDVSTDPFAYTYFAENMIDYGDSNPFDDPRWIVYQKSTQTVAAYIVYQILGTGRAQGNLTAALLNLIAIVLLALGIKNYGSRLAAVLFALIACTNFTLTVFARIPFLEASQNLWLAAAFYFFSLAKRGKHFIALSGAAAAAAAFFGKMIALYAAGFFFVVWLAMYLTAEDNRKTVLRNAAVFYVSYAAIGLFWFLFTYLPSATEVSSYYAEQGMGLYGAPRAFKEVSAFFWQVQNLLWERRFFEKLPFVTLLASVAGGMVIWYMVRAAKVKKIASPLTIGSILLFFWLIFAYAALFPFNYRPLRYQTTLMFPMMALGGLILAIPFEAVRSKLTTKRSKKQQDKFLYTAIAWGIWFAPIVCTIVLVLGQSSNSRAFGASVESSIFLYTLLFAGIGFGLAWLVKAFSPSTPNLRTLGQSVAALLLVAYLAVNITAFASWMNSREYSLISADRDLANILKDNAVLSGSYASALTQENKLKCIHHQFGVEKPDRDFFRKFPITHLLVDPGNEDRARKDYSQLMNSADLVTVYSIRGMRVRLYRISEASPNADAREYSPSDFELFRYWMNRTNSDSATAYLNKFVSSGKRSYSSDVYLGETYSELKQFDKAIEHFRSAYYQAPGDPIIAYQLGLVFASTLNQEGSLGHADSALVYLRIANARIPDNPTLVQTIDQLEQMR